MRALATCINFFIIICLNSCDSDDGVFFTTEAPVGDISHNQTFSYTFSAMSPTGNPITYEVSKPSWVEYDQQATISGIPDWENINRTFTITITANDGVSSAIQEVRVRVIRGEIICDQDFGDPALSAYVLPWKSGISYELIQTYCPPNPAWGHHNWFAYDFDLQIGDSIYASRSGRVIAVQEHNPDGTRECGANKENYIFILHDDGTVMQYVHLTTNGVIVEVDDEIARGELIGISGDSGCSSGPHLHVALFRNRTNYDRQSTIPFNYSNADGPLDNNMGLVQDGIYKALPY